LATARNSDHLVDLASKFGASVRIVPLDVTNEAQAKYAVDAALQTFGGLDVLVNNAGYGNVSSVEETSLADFAHRLRRIYSASSCMIKAVLPYFRERRGSHFIQISSIGGRVGPVGRAAYAAAKFGVEGFSESLSKEVGPLGIKVTIVESVTDVPADFASYSDRPSRRSVEEAATSAGHPSPIRRL